MSHNLCTQIGENYRREFAQARVIFSLIIYVCPVGILKSHRRAVEMFEFQRNGKEIYKLAICSLETLFVINIFTFSFM